MSNYLSARKWSNQFIEECSAFVATSPTFPFASGDETLRKSTSMSHLLKSSSSQKYRSIADSLSKRYDSQITNVTHSTENSLNRLSCIKGKYDHQCTTRLKKMGKENKKYANGQSDNQNTSVMLVAAPIVTNTIHTVHTIFVPAPPVIVQQVPHFFPNQSNPSIHLLRRPVSAPKTTFNYISPYIANSPNSKLLSSHPSQVTIMR